MVQEVRKGRKIIKRKGSKFFGIIHTYSDISRDDAFYFVSYESLPKIHLINLTATTYTAAIKHWWRLPNKEYIKIVQGKDLPEIDKIIRTSVLPRNYYYSDKWTPEKITRVIKDRQKKVVLGYKRLYAVSYIRDGHEYYHIGIRKTILKALMAHLKSTEIKHYDLKKLKDPVCYRIFTSRLTIGKGITRKIIRLLRKNSHRFRNSKERIPGL